MKFFRSTIPFILLLLSVSTVSADGIREPKPGGLSFGMSISDLHTMGVVIDERTVDGGLVHLYASTLPKTLSDFDFATLAMGNDDQLARASLFSRRNPNDIFGYLIVNRFDELKADLDKLYGTGELMVRRPQGEYAAPENFAKAIEIASGTMMAKWTVSGVSIFLRVGAVDGSTYYEIRYIDNQRMKNIENHIKSGDLGAL